VLSPGSFRIEAREANGATKIEGGDIFVVTLEHADPRYQEPLCVHQDGCTDLAKCPCPYVLRSPWDIDIISPYGNGLYIVSYMTTIAGVRLHTTAVCLAIVYATPRSDHTSAV
jgi:hypothetical protein